MRFVDSLGSASRVVERLAPPAPVVGIFRTPREQDGVGPRERVLGVEVEEPVVERGTVAGEGVDPLEIRVRGPLHQPERGRHHVHELEGIVLGRGLEQSRGMDDARYAQGRLDGCWACVTKPFS